MKKFFYLLIVFLIGIFIAYISYNGNKYEHISGLVNEAIEKEEYAEIAKIFGGCCDTAPLAKDDSDKVDLVVFTGTSIVDVTYGEERTYAYEETYYIYMFNMKYEYKTFDGTDNDSAMVFYSADGKTYNYPFIVNDNTNSEYLEKENFTKETALLNSSRDVVSNVDTWNFMYINLTKSMIEYIVDDLGGNIAGIKLLDNTGNEVVKVDVNLDLSQKFYSDINDLIVNYNKWLTAYAKDENVKEAEEEFYNFYNPWQENFEANKETTGYSFPYDSSYVVPNKIMWITVGQMAIYGVIMSCFYMIFFHLEQLKDLFDRIFKKKKKGEKPKTIHIKKDEPVVEAEVYEEPKLIETEKVNEAEVYEEPTDKIEE